MNNKDLLDQIKEISGLTNLDNLSVEEVKKILSLIGEQRLKESHIIALIECYPHFSSIAIESLRMISTCAQGAKDSQKEALQAISSLALGIINCLEILSKNANSDETREKLAMYIIEAGKITVEFGHIAADINKENNDFWIKIAKIGASVAVLAGVLVGGVAIAKGNSTD